MALKLWYPFTKDLSNNGYPFENIKTYNNIELCEDGKLGKCAYFNGGNIKVPTFFNENPQEMSLCAWLKATNNETNYGFHLCAWGNNMRICFLKDKSAVRAIINKGDGITGYSSILKNTEVEIGKWYHIAVTYKNGRLKIYINGDIDVQHITATTELEIKDITPFSIGTYSSETASCYVNDYRLYDHCLSDAEVKEISKGLVLHYTMDSMYGNSNLLTNSSLLNGTPTNVVSIYHCNDITSQTFTQDGMYIVTPETGNPNNGVAFYIDSFTNLGIPWGKRITFSVDVKGECNGSVQPSIKLWVNRKSTSWWQDKEIAATYYNITSEWKRISVTGLIPDYDESYTSDRLWLHFAASYNSKIYYKNVKLELGTTATVWCLNSADINASDYGLDKIYDNSGFGNDGVPNNIEYSTERIKGLTSSVFDSAKIPYIVVPKPDYKSYNISFGGWLYKEDWSIWEKNETIISVINGEIGFSYNMYIESPQALGVKAAIFLAPNLSSPLETEYYQVGYGWKTSYLSSGWHHIFASSSNDNIKLYIDGKLVGTDDVKKYYTITNSNKNAISRDTSPFNGKIDDFRIYTTTLSDNDILQLYKETQKIDNLGNLYCSELSEVNINNYIEDWEDITKIKMSGWDGSKKYVKDGNYLLLTATNGWRTFGWDVEDAIGKNVIFEFDYSFEDITNWLTTPWIINSDEIQYGGTGDGNFSNKNEGWHHFRTKITSAKKFFGFNLRGTDNSGKNLSCRFRNIKIRDASDKNINFLSNGEIELDEIFEGNNQVKIIKDGNIIEVNEIYEN